MDPRRPCEGRRDVRRLDEGPHRCTLSLIMGVPGSPFRKIGIELTGTASDCGPQHAHHDPQGKVALDDLGESEDFTKSSTPKVNWISTPVHPPFPGGQHHLELRLGYGGNVLLARSASALGSPSYMGFTEGGWLSHMLIVGVQSPDGEITTSRARSQRVRQDQLAMLIPPDG